MTPLHAQQQALAGWLLYRRAGDAPAIASVDAAQRRARLRIYADAYRWRLIDVLQQDYPVLRAVLGAARFDAIAAAYLADMPSQEPSVRHLGARFPRWYRQRSGRDDAIVDLAALEWIRGEVFDAADAVACGVEDLLALAPERWPDLHLILHPAVRRLRVASNAFALLDAHGDAVRPAPCPAPATTWLLWRHDFDVHWRRLENDEAQALESLAAGETFADWSERLPGDMPAMRAAGLLKRWLADGLVAGLAIDRTP